jgi:hypothetical protein
MLECGNLDGERLWPRTLEAIETLQATERPKGMVVQSGARAFWLAEWDTSGAVLASPAASGSTRTNEGKFYASEKPFCDGGGCRSGEVDPNHWTAWRHLLGGIP